MEGDLHASTLAALAASVSSMAASLEGVRVRLDEGNRRMEALERAQERTVNRLEHIEQLLAGFSPRVAALEQWRDESEEAERSRRATAAGVVISLVWQSVLTVWLALRGGHSVP